MTNIVKNKNGIEFDIDAIATDLNGKMDRDGVNAECPTLLSRTPNNQGGVVEIWSDGYCVQTGVWTGSVTTAQNIETAIKVTLDTPYKDDKYICLPMQSTQWVITSVQKTTGYFNFYFGGYAGSRTLNEFSWRAEGYIR